jgi:hypothetical protein
VFLQVPSCDHFALIVLWYLQIRSSTLHGVRSFLTHVIMISHATSCTPPVWSIQENVIFDRARRSLQFRSFTPIKDVSIGNGTPWSPFLSRASEEAIRQRGSSDECNMIRFYKMLCHPRIEGKAAWETEKFSSIQMSRYPLFSTANASFIAF